MKISMIDAERSEESTTMGDEILRCAQNDKSGTAQNDKSGTAQNDIRSTS
jgi:hypothetical protein